MLNARGTHYSVVLTRVFDAIVFPVASELIIHVQTVLKQQSELKESMLSANVVTANTGRNMYMNVNNDASRPRTECTGSSRPPLSASDASL